MVGIDMETKAAIALAADRTAADRPGEQLLELGAAAEQQGDPAGGLDADQGDVAAGIAEVEVEQRVGSLAAGILAVRLDAHLVAGRRARQMAALGSADPAQGVERGAAGLADRG